MKEKITGVIRENKQIFFKLATARCTIFFNQSECSPKSKATPKGQTRFFAQSYRLLTKRFLSSHESPVAQW